MKDPAPPIDGQTFTIQELSRESGVSVASIKFYLRESLLAPGDPSRPGRAYYDGRHVRRLALIRALRDVAGLSIDVIRRALAAAPDCAGLVRVRATTRRESATWREADARFARCRPMAQARYQSAIRRNE